MTRHKSNQRGVSLVTAIFLLVVLAALGAYMLTLSGVQTATTSQSLQAARAYFGARAGLDWAIHRAVGPAAGSGLCDPSASFSPTGAGLTDINVTVTCTPKPYATGGGSGTYYVYYLTSTASYGTSGSSDYVERKLEASVCRASNPGSSTEC